MNVITHRIITIEYDVWEPQQKHILEEENDLLHSLKEKKLLAHAGYVKVVFRDKEN